MMVERFNKGGLYIHTPYVFWDGRRLRGGGFLDSYENIAWGFYSLLVLRYHGHRSL